jgi:crotonobetainyl-CoA:carnitine CoA-transferase CaiB-like acyl-CoA transferase
LTKEYIVARTKEALRKFIEEQRCPEKYKGLPLEGKRVLDFSTVVAAPYTAALLGDAGAEVIKIENPRDPDGLRSWGVIEKSGIEPYYSVFGRNKFPVTINLKSENGKKLFLQLIRESDVLIENMRVGVMDRLGLGHELLLKENPGLVIGKISGYGMTGPYATQPGFGTLAEAFSGFSYLNGYPGGSPTSPPMALADVTAGVHLAYAILLSLISAKKGERGGQVIDVSLYEPLFGYLGGEFLSFALTGELPEPIGNELRAAAPRNNYKTKDGKWIAMSCSAQKPWEALAKVMGREDLIDDPRFKTNVDRIKPESRSHLNDVIQQWYLTMTNEEVLAICRREGITAGPIPNMADIAQDVQYKERGTIIEIEDPVTGIMLKMPDVAFRMLGRPGKIRFPGLPHGSANEVIYKDLLGYSDEQIAKLKAEAVI